LHSALQDRVKVPDGDQLATRTQRDVHRLARTGHRRTATLAAMVEHRGPLGVVPGQWELS
jgi:hypothetical protein